MAQLNAANILDGSNRLIDALPVNEREQVVESSDCIVLEFGDMLPHPDEVVTDVFFPVAGYVSEVFQLENHGPLAINLVGNEDMLGSSQVLGLPSTPLQSMVQGLEAQACVCYRDVLENYARYLPACVQLRTVT